MTSIAIDVLGVGKKFRLHTDRPNSLKEAILQRGGSEVEDFWALRDISMSIPTGSFYGLIGHNGCGKSTLLRLMAGIYGPTTGKIDSKGRISALLELGSGFHPDLTGRENIYLNGAMLGIGRKQMKVALDDIIDFSGIGDFIDSPVKVYSSGMYVRLGFSVAIHVDPEILLIDEVIAVGDEEFQRRCFDHLHRLRERGVTIVFVSHSTGLMEKLCDTVAWIDHGSLKLVGDSRDTCRAYLEHVNGQENARLRAEVSSDEQISELGGERRGDGRIRIQSVEFLSPDFRTRPAATSGDPLIVRLWYESFETISSPTFELTIHHENGAHVASPSTRLIGLETGTVVPGVGYVDVMLDRVLLMPGRYVISTAIRDHDEFHTFDAWQRSHKLVVQPGSSLERSGIMELGALWQPPVPYDRPK